MVPPDQNEMAPKLQQKTLVEMGETGKKTFSRNQHLPEANQE